MPFKHGKRKKEILKANKNKKVLIAEFCSYGHVMMWVEPSLIGQNWSLHYKKKCLKSSQPAFVCLSFYTCSKTKPRNCDIRMRRKKKTLQETSMSCKTLRHLKKKKFCMVNITVCQLRGLLTQWLTGMERLVPALTQTHSPVLGQSPSVGGTKVSGDCVSAACWFVHGPVTPESRLGPPAYTPQLLVSAWRRGSPMMFML